MKFYFVILTVLTLLSPTTRADVPCNDMSKKLISLVESDFKRLKGYQFVQITSCELFIAKVAKKYGIELWPEPDPFLRKQGYYFSGDVGPQLLDIGILFKKDSSGDVIKASCAIRTFLYNNGEEYYLFSNCDKFTEDKDLANQINKIIKLPPNN